MPKDVSFNSVLSKQEFEEPVMEECRQTDAGRSHVELPEWNLTKWRKGHGIYRDPMLDDCDFLYRYMTAGDAFKMLEARKLRFKYPGAWPDPYEAWWCKQVFRKDTHLDDAVAYASCWTTRYADEPFWRLYSPRSEGIPGQVESMPAVRFRVRRERLLSWFSNTVKPRQTGKAFMGRIRYVPRTQMEEYSGHLRVRDDWIVPVAAKSLLMKLRAYKFEDEIRLLWVDRGTQTEHLDFSFDPLDFFDQVMVGPTKHVTSESLAEAGLLERGVPIQLICFSSIFRPPGSPPARARARRSPPLGNPETCLKKRSHL